MKGTIISCEKKYNSLNQPFHWKEIIYERDGQRYSGNKMETMGGETYYFGVSGPRGKDFADIDEAVDAAYGVNHA